MIGGMWNFLKRHRRKFFYIGTFVGGVYLSGRYLLNKLRVLQEKEAADCLEHARKQHHFDSNQRTCNTTVLSMLPQLREAVIKLLDTKELTNSLKNKPSNKLEIWEELKLKSFVRSVVSTYSICSLIVVLRVKLNIIGGYMYLDSLLNQNGVSQELTIATLETQQIYLEKVQYILNQGLEDLVCDVTEAVKNEIGSIGLKESLTLCDIDHIIRNIRQHLEHKQTSSSSAFSLCQYVLPKTSSDRAQACSLTNQERVLAQLFSETREVIESGDFRSVLSTCLDKGFSRLIDRISDYFKPTNGERAEQVRIPLAKLIPVINGLLHIVLADVPNLFIQDVLLMDQVKDFAANIYEAFSHPAMLNS